MRLWIRDADEGFPITYPSWKTKLWLALTTEIWQPAGTLPPRWWPADQPWNGSYVVSDNPRMTAADCHALANALELASTRIPTARARLEPTTQVPLDVRLIDQSDRDGGGPYSVRLSTLLRGAHALRDELPLLVAFLRRVPLPDGELVIHSPEVSTRQGLPAGSP
jgi:hypothetical protein